MDSQYGKNPLTLRALNGGAGAHPSRPQRSKILVKRTRNHAGKTSTEQHLEKIALFESGESDRKMFWCRSKMPKRSEHSLGFTIVYPSESLRNKVSPFLLPSMLRATTCRPPLLVIRTTIAGSSLLCTSTKDQKILATKYNSFRNERLSSGMKFPRLVFEPAPDLSAITANIDILQQLGVTIQDEISKVEKVIRQGRVLASAKDYRNRFLIELRKQARLLNLRIKVLGRA